MFLIGVWCNKLCCVVLFWQNLLFFFFLLQLGQGRSVGGGGVFLFYFFNQRSLHNNCDIFLCVFNLKLLWKLNPNEV
jgi:hypothetical protein